METDVFGDQLPMFREIVDSASNGVVMIDTEGTIRIFNQAARKVLAIRKPKRS
jgi:sensor histidine kinase regulating citrate/malate metabolism